MGSCVSSDDKSRLTSGHSMLGKPGNGYKDLNSGMGSHCDKLINPSTGSSLLSSSVGASGGGGSSSGAKLSSVSNSSGLRGGSSLISSPASVLESNSSSGLPSARSSSSGHHHGLHGHSNMHHSSPSSSHNQTVVTALYTYQAKDEGDLSFRKGDKLLVIDDSDPDWWLAKNMATNAKGYIPRNYVVAEVLETEE